MTTSATKIVSATDNTNKTNNYNNNSNNNNSNSNHSQHDNERRNSDASNNSFKIVNKNEYIAMKAQTPVALNGQTLHEEEEELATNDTYIKNEIAPLIIPTLPTTTTTNIVQNGIINLTTSSSSLSSTTSTTRAMQSDEDFNIRFVNLVRLHKCLYNKKVPEYRNRDNQEKAWSLISQETRESVIHCKERWRNLRACLSRYIKQQSGSDPQHKPYYLTEHMAFLLPFLKSSRNGGPMNYSIELHQQLTNNNSSSQHANHLSALFPISATSTVNPMHLTAMTVIPMTNSTALGGVEIKHSLSENDDEETIDAFDPAITGTLQQQQQEAINLQHFPQQARALHYPQQPPQQQHISPALSDTASADSLQHFIPDVQLSEAPSSEYNQNHQANDNNHHHQAAPSMQNVAKRIKLECDGNNSLNGRICSCGLDNTVSNNPDMEFFRSILPDIAFLTAQQKRKLKIGILELIDEVATRYPAQATTVTTTSSNTTVNNQQNGRQRNTTIDRRK